MEHDRYRERVESVMTLRLSPAEWDRVHRELTAAVTALAAGDETALKEPMTLLLTYDGLRTRRRVNPDMGTAQLSPMPDAVRAVANDLVHRLTPEQPVEQSSPRTAATPDDDAGTADRH
ncbi:CATRA system-associated protein [Actinoplanes xinjiangensis]|uniref:CATRA system-associated protein n=1 Tax=Actinoplanes xinjiangensis TaxID=512350 RepID=UPI0034377CFE